MKIMIKLCEIQLMKKKKVTLCAVSKVRLPYNLMAYAWLKINNINSDDLKMYIFKYTIT